MARLGLELSMSTRCTKVRVAGSLQVQRALSQEQGYRSIGGRFTLAGDHQIKLDAWRRR